MSRCKNSCLRTVKNRTLPDQNGLTKNFQAPLVVETLPDKGGGDNESGNGTEEKQVDGKETNGFEGRKERGGWN